MIKVYDHFKNFEVEGFINIKAILKENFKNKVSTVDSVPFKLIKLSLTEELIKETGVINNGAKILVKSNYKVIKDNIEYEIIPLIKKGNEIIIDEKIYKAEKQSLYELTDYQSFIIKEVFYE